MLIRSCTLEGVKEVFLTPIEDERGWFLKTIHAPTFEEDGLELCCAESFTSKSHRHVLRGMHFQRPPYDHVKLVRCVTGQILDVVLDLRRESKTFRQFEQFDLSAEYPQLLYIPKGFAHGFLTLSEEALVEYHTSMPHCPSHDDGVRWDSFGMNWNDVKPIVSLRDQSLPDLASAFTWDKMP